MSPAANICRRSLNVLRPLRDRLLLWLMGGSVYQQRVTRSLVARGASPISNASPVRWQAGPHGKLSFVSHAQESSVALAAVLGLPRWHAGNRKPK